MRIAGVKVGTVTGVALDGPSGRDVKVSFRVKNAFIGDQTQAIIKIKTVLGRKYLELDSEGTGKQKPGSMIPLSRTLTPFDVYPAFSDLTKTVGAIDTDDAGQVAGDDRADLQGHPGLGQQHAGRAVPAVEHDLVAGPGAAHPAGPGQLGHRRAGRPGRADQQADHRRQPAADRANERRDAIRTLFLNTSALSLQISGLVSDNQKTLKPALDQLKGVLDMLEKNLDNIDRGLALLGAVLPGVRQHPGQRPVVRHLHPEPVRRRPVRHPHRGG